jgi:hypothetical protein
MHVVTNYYNLDGDPPVELRACVDKYIYGFAAKLDSGNVMDM